MRGYKVAAQLVLHDERQHVLTPVAEGLRLHGSLNLSLPSSQVRLLSSKTILRSEVTDGDVGR